MKRFHIFTKLALLTFLLLVFFIQTVSAQRGAPRKSLKASVTQRIGVDADITIDYSRPGVKGRKIWGDVVPYGFAPGIEYSDNKPFPWRAGADENTTFETTKDLLVEGKKLAAGKYGVHMIPSETDWIIIFSENDSSWGSYKYNKAEDALRINVVPVKAPNKEWLMFGFDNLAGTSATAFLHWEKLKVPFKIKLVE